MISFLAIVFLFAEATHDEKLLQVVKTIDEQNVKLNAELSKLKELIGLSSGLEGFEPRAMTGEVESRVKASTEDGMRAFQKLLYESAKGHFQSAWEWAPNEAGTNYNLGLTYLRLGNVPMAKKMLKTAIDIDTKLLGKESIEAFLAGKKDLAADLKKTQDEAEKTLATDLTNLGSQVSSYMGSERLTLTEKMKKVTPLLDDMHERAKNSQRQSKDFLLKVAEYYAYFRQYDAALRCLNSYSATLQNEVLPEQYYALKSDYEIKSQERARELAKYLGNVFSPDLDKKAQRDARELEIFASQMDSFVQEPVPGNKDFMTLAERLKEYKWAGKDGRHVLVVDRYGDVLYSSLEGTLPIDRYQDSQGRPFLRDIVSLGDKMSLKQVENTTLALSVGNKNIDYVLMYTYIPKHQCFIVVRVPQLDLGRDMKDIAEK